VSEFEYNDACKVCSLLQIRLRDMGVGNKPASQLYEDMILLQNHALKRGLATF